MQLNGIVFGKLMRGGEFRSPDNPDLKIAGLRLWIRGRQFPEATDYWDGNWLNIDGYCEYPGARVDLSGPLIRTDELERFADACVILYRDLSGNVLLETIEPNINIALSGNGRGQIRVSLSVTPDQLNQRHSFEDEFDQTDLAKIVRSCSDILKRFPVIAVDTV